jgi:vitamin B12 transporter
VERIEVVEGGGSALYGSGAVGGIINIITQSATSTPDARLLVGSFADRELSVEVPGFGIDRTVVANSYGLPPDSAIGPQWMDAACEATSGHAAFDRRIGAVAASLRATFTTDHLGVPGGTSFYSPGNREDDVNDAAQISLAHKAARAESTLQFGGSDQQVAFWSPSLAFTTDGGDDASFRNVVDQGRGTVVYGIDLSRNVVRGDDGFGDITTNPVSHAAAYAQQTFETSPGDRSYVAVRAERDGSEGGRVSPSAGFTHRIAAGVSLKANLANAFRAPNATELYFPGYGNPQLKSELSSVGDLTIDDANVLGGTSLGWFFNRSKNLIVYNPVTNAAANVDTAAIYGLTYEVRTRPYHRISASFDVTDLYQALDLTTGGRLPNDPVLTTNLELVYHGSETAAIESAGVTVKAAGDRGPTSPELPLYDQPIAFADTTAYVRFRLGQRALLSLRGYNLGNERYAQIHGYPVPGRSFTAEISTH